MQHLLTEVKQYLDTVCEQIRFQKAHESIKTELQQHIIDQANAYMEKGMEEQKAFETAVVDMGDPVLVGTELDRVHRPKMEWSFIVLVILLSLASIVMRFIVQTYYYQNDLPYLDVHMLDITILFYIVIGIAVTIFFYHIDFTVLANHSDRIYIAYLLIMAILCIYLRLFGGVVNGAYRFVTVFWFDITIPYFIYLFPIVLTALLYDNRGNSYRAILLCVASFILPAMFSFAQDTHSPTIVMGGVSILLIGIAIAKDWFCVKKLYAFALLFSVVILIIILFRFSPFFSYIDYRNIHFAITDPFGEDFTRTMLQANVKGASLFGASDIKVYTESDRLVPWGFGSHGGSIGYFITFLLHYCGWFFVLLLCAVYFFFMIRGFLLTYKQKSQLGSMTAFAILLTFSALAIWNIVVNSGFFIDVNPLGIPFFSTDNSIDILLFIMLGILLSVFRTGKYVKEGDIVQKQNDKFLRWENGALIIQFKRQKKGGNHIE